MQIYSTGTGMDMDYVMHTGYAGNRIKGYVISFKDYVTCLFLCPD